MTLKQSDIDTFLAAMRAALPAFQMQKAGEVEKPAVKEREELIQAYLQKHPAETRDNAVMAVYQANAGLYERCRKEETVGKHGQTLKEAYDRVDVVGFAKSATSVDEDIAARVQTLVAKTKNATPEMALAFLNREHPELLQQWMRESYA